MHLDPPFFFIEKNIDPCENLFENRWIFLSVNFISPTAGTLTAGVGKIYWECSAMKSSHWITLRTRFTMFLIVMSLFALMGLVNVQSTVPADPPAWSATTLYNKAGLYVEHKGKVWVSQWAIAYGAEPGANHWNGWKSAAALSKDAANPTPWDADSLYDAAGFYVSHEGKVWVSQWYILRGHAPGQTSNGWKLVRVLPKWASVSASERRSFAINSKGELYGWGDNDGGELGDGTMIDRSSPTRIGTASDWAHVSTGDSHSLAINTKGELYAWGNNGSGRLGDGATTNRTTPTRIGTASDWARVSAGDSHSLAINTKGELYAWGNNGSGELGDGTTTNRSSPTRIGTASDWARVSAGGSHSLAINTKGELYAWGNNGSGRLGDGTTTNRTTPTRIGTASDWARVSAGDSHSLAINTKGELYAWGNNGSGELGDGTTTNRTSPTRIGTASDWAHISAGDSHSLAINTKGELYAWGNNGSGRLGDGTTTNRSSPTRIGTASDWAHVSAGGSHSLAITTKGHSYAWGNNNSGELGDGTTTNRTSPIRMDYDDEVPATPVPYFHDVLKDGGKGPAMVVLPTGSFSMGSPTTETGRDSDEGPVRTVTISKRIAMGKYEVTFADYDRFAKATKRKLPGDQKWGRGTRPVINVSQADAKAYAVWLSAQTGKRYRLPTEAEWEYAVRAGTTTRYSWGDSIACSRANYGRNAGGLCNTSADASLSKTVAVGSFAANPFGLHDMHGNVDEWVEDCYLNTYTGAPTDGSARTTGCDGVAIGVVIRGGSWSIPPWDLRSAGRNFAVPSIGFQYYGFRVVQDLGVVTSFRDTLKDGGKGPEMVVLPTGRFSMGSLYEHDGTPVRTVTISKRIAMGKYEVTFADYDRFAKATKRTLPGDQKWGRDTRPVINVSQADAKAYAVWLSAQTGKRYRLPTEAEWEYAARAGTTTWYSVGDSITCSQASYGRLHSRPSADRPCNTSADASLSKTVAVGSFAANPFGLYDMHGNVWEWMEDCYVIGYTGAPTDGSARTTGCGSTTDAVLRGASWRSASTLWLHSALRSYYRPSRTEDNAGFRLVQDLTAPANLQATAGNAQVSVSWTAVNDAASYTLYYSQSSLAGATDLDTRATGITRVANITGTSRTVTGLTNGTRYYFVVRAITATGRGAPSLEVSATPQLSAPTGLSLSAGNARASAGWTAVSNAASYTLYYSQSSLAGATDLDTRASGITRLTGLTGTAHTVTGLTNGTRYYFRVKAVNAGGRSAASAEASVIPLAPPSGLNLTAGDAQATASWSAASGASTYTLYHATTPWLGPRTSTPGPAASRG